MNEMNRPEIPKEEYGKEVGSDMPHREPLALLPEREWLSASIVEVKYQVAMFNNQVQYVSFKDESNEDVPVLDPDGNKIMRKEFEFVFAFTDYKLPNNDPRKAWLRLGSSFGEKAHLPEFLKNVLTNLEGVHTPDEIIRICKGKYVMLQVKNKTSKDGTKEYQNVVWDAVKANNPYGPPQPTGQPAVQNPAGLDQTGSDEYKPSDVETPERIEPVPGKGWDD